VKSKSFLERLWSAAPPNREVLAEESFFNIEVLDAVWLFRQLRYKRTGLLSWSDSSRSFLPCGTREKCERSQERSESDVVLTLEP
jgi:hypothetical protein